MWTAVAILAASIVVMSWVGVRLTTELETLGARLHFSEALLGIVTALGADSPEICSAFTALMSNHHDVGYGVVLGSNIFNLAGLLGLSALVVGRVTIGRAGLWFNGGASLLVSAVVVALLLQWIPVWLSLVLLLVVLTPYVILNALPAARIAHLPLPRLTRRFLETAVSHLHQSARARSTRASRGDVAWLVGSLGLIVVSSVGAVRSAVALGHAWGVSEAVVGTLVLAALTSIPNVIAAVQLARAGRGAAVVSEALNSNTLNILAGISLPALLIGFAVPSQKIIFAAFWLLGMKLVALAATSRRQGLGRGGGAILVLLYLAFALVVVFWR